jgi:hypothetical protein
MIHQAKHTIRHRCRFWTLFVSILLVTSASSPILAHQTPLPVSVSSGPPRPPSTIYTPSPAAPTTPTDLDLPPLKAVLLVGPIDGNNGPWTLQEIANMELAAAQLEAHGVTVFRFYPGNSDTDQIEQAAEGAHFLFYRGHGVYDGNLPYPTVGGFHLSSGFYLSDQIRQNLHLAPNAIVMLYGCFTTGSSSAPGDMYDIGIDEAKRRVAQYSDPFFDVGAGGYYANRFGNAFEHYVSNLFAGQTLGAAYENYSDFNPTTVHRATHPDHPGLALWLDKDYWRGYWEYNNAFAGKQDQTLEDLFPVAELTGIPATVRFTATVESGVIIQPSHVSITPTNGRSESGLDWTLSTQGDWFSVSPLVGSTPASFTITPQGFATDQPSTYTGSVTVTITAPDYTRNPVQTTDLTLQVLAPQLGGVPGSVGFVYSRTDEEFLQARYGITPRNVGSETPLHWEATTDSSWLNITPNSGTTPQPFSLTATGFDTATVSAYTGWLTVTVTEPSFTHLSPWLMPVSLRVIDTPFCHVYLPTLSRGRLPE